MRSTQALCVTLTIFLAVISQSTISAAQVFSNHTGKETMEIYDSVNEVLTISVEYKFQWKAIGPDRFFSLPSTLVGSESFSSTGTSACTKISTRSIKCPRGVTSFSISYRYKLQIYVTEDGTERFYYSSDFGWIASTEKATYELFYPSSWKFLIPNHYPVPAATSGRFQWVVWQTISSAFNARVEFQIVVPCTLPSGETTASNGWAIAEGYPTIHKWMQTLTPATGSFSGQQVRETDAGGGPDTCYFPGSAFGPQTGIAGPYLGDTWSVAAQNRWGEDWVGWPPALVRYYRAQRRVPCGTTVLQQMTFQCPNDSIFYSYGPINTLKGSMTQTTVTSERAGRAATRMWP